MSLPSGQDEYENDNEHQRTETDVHMLVPFNRWSSPTYPMIPILKPVFI